jgi:hypothetical protein
VTISFRVTGLVPRASDGTASSLLSRTPMSRASLATLAAPTCCISCAVIVFFDWASASRQGHRLTAGRPAIRRAPDLGATDGDFHRLVDQRVVRAGTLAERFAIDEGLEGRAGLAARLLHMVEGVLLEVAAADPGLDVAVARVDRQEAGLDLSSSVVAARA